MILVEDWAEIRRLHRAEQMPIRAIARHLGISKNTVKRALATDRPPKYQRPVKGSAVDAVEVQIRELLRETPTMPATVIAERIGWDRVMTILKERVRELRLAYVLVDPVSRTVCQPGELAQCDLWFPEADIPLGYGQSGRPPVLVMVMVMVSRWGEVFGDETVAAAMIDRLVHHAEVHSLKGDSYRMNGRELGRVPTTDND
ncbi:ATP-binding protein [Streptomyces sp. NPDC001774]